MQMLVSSGFPKQPPRCLLYRIYKRTSKSAARRKGFDAANTLPQHAAQHSRTMSTCARGLVLFWFGGVRDVLLVVPLCEKKRQTATHAVSCRNSCRNMIGCTTSDSLRQRRKKW